MNTSNQIQKLKKKAVFVFKKGREAKGDNDKSVTTVYTVTTIHCLKGLFK